MIIKVSSLPSRGYNSLVDSINVEPINYYDIIKYSSKTFNLPIDKVIWDIENLIMTIPGWESISAYDFKSLIFTRKYISATDGTVVKLIVKGEPHTLDVSKIKFIDLPVELKNISGVTIAGKYLRFSVPSLKRFYDTLKDLSHLDPVDVKLAMLIAALREDYPVHYVLDLFKKAKGSDIALLDYLSTLLNHSCEPITLEGGAVINNLDDLITDFFRFVLFNNKLDKTKIKVTEAMES